MMRLSVIRSLSGSVDTTSHLRTCPRKNSFSGYSISSVLNLDLGTHPLAPPNSSRSSPWDLTMLTVPSVTVPTCEGS